MEFARASVWLGDDEEDEKMRLSESSIHTPKELWEELETTRRRDGTTEEIPIAHLPAWVSSWLHEELRMPAEQGWGELP